MQVRSAVELIVNFAWMKTFVSNDDTFIDIVVSYECRVSCHSQVSLSSKQSTKLSNSQL